jgi:hypothetical protein
VLDVEAAKEQVKEIDANEEKMAKLEKLIGENNGICVCVCVCVCVRERGCVRGCVCV